MAAADAAHSRNHPPPCIASSPVIADNSSYATTGAGRWDLGSGDAAECAPPAVSFLLLPRGAGCLNIKLVVDSGDHRHGGQQHHEVDQHQNQEGDSDLVHVANWFPEPKGD